MSYINTLSSLVYLIRVYLGVIVVSYNDITLKRWIVEIWDCSHHEKEDSHRL